jgi:signal transduction histidine kinase
MRWPLRYQLMLLAAAMMVLVLLVVSASTAYLSAQRVQQEIQGDVQQLATALAEAQYPLTSPVLRQIHAFSGVHLLLADADHQPIATSGGIDFASLSDEMHSRQPTTPHELQLKAPEQFGNERYFHTAIPISSHILHLFYPEDRLREARRQAFLLPWIVGLVALPVVVVLAMLFATQISRPIIHLRDQVRQIATGKYASRVSVTRSDEVGQLADALNDLAEQLERFDHETRHNERLRVLHQLGSGIAHQMRNAVTGALMAADVHERSGDNESLEVVRRQLRLLESNIKRFLTLSQPTDLSHERLNLAEVLREAISLVEPAFKHVHVELNFDEPKHTESTVLGNRDALHDAMTNLLLNAMEAAASQTDGEKVVTVSMQTGADRHATTICIADTGPGPPAEILDSLFEPFATSKPEGTGLGLFVVKRTLEDHRGSVDWQRVGEQTEFILEFPTLTS